MRRVVLFCLVFLLVPFFAQAQGAVFSVKGGPIIGFQKWDNQLGRRNPLLSYNLILGVEELTEDTRFTIFAQAGLHNRGTSMRTTYFLLNGNLLDQNYGIKFTNLGLSLGAKKRFDAKGRFTPYYLIGARAEYTIKTNLAEFTERNKCYPIYPIDNDQFIKKFNYGAIFGGGFEFAFSELTGGMLEFSVNPDFSSQYVQPSFLVSNNCSVNNQPIQVPKREIKNITFEISLGFRFLRKVEYID